MSRASKQKLMALKPEHREGEEGKEELAEDAGKQHFHVLAVDDSLVDRKLLERLLRVSSYHGNVEPPTKNKTIIQLFHTTVIWDILNRCRNLLNTEEKIAGLNCFWFWACSDVC